MSLELLQIASDYGPETLCELECPDPECGGRMLVNPSISLSHGVECPIEDCDEEVEIA